MQVSSTAVVLALVLLAGAVAFIELGRRLGVRRFAHHTEAAKAGIGPLEGAIYGLLGLLIAFTFSGASSRIDVRRGLIVQEANNIGTAYLRLDLLPAGTQPALRDLFRAYVDSRIATYKHAGELDAAQAELARSLALQGEIWRQAVAACQQAPSTATTTLVLPAINDMIDIVTVRTVAAKTHPPSIIFWMLVLFALVSSLLAGYGMAQAPRRPWLHIIGFAVLMSFMVYIIVDIEYPRRGLIRIDQLDQLLVDVRNSMK